ncbi:MAG TPA: ABC transporter permease, partial [Bryobacteraceae bacterium]|nr:ABC transporter permease [Bryobacteraceae bacterium]
MRYSLRSLRKSPGFALAAVLILGLGIGASAAMFSFVNGLLLRPIPFPESERLVRIESLQGGVVGKLMPREWEELDRLSSAFEGAAGWYPSQYNLVVNGSPEVVRACMTTANLFRVLGVRLTLGSSWEEGSHRQRNPAVVLSHPLWKSRMNGDTDIVRKSITLDNAPYNVVGVAPPEFNFPIANDVYRAAHLGGAQNNNVRSLFVVARLRQGISLSEAQSRLEVFAQDQARQYPDTNRDIGFRIVPLREAYVGEIRPYLLLTMALVALVLCIALANVVNLLLARGIGRSRDFAIRSAVGATGRDILREVLTESLVLTMLGGVVGVGLAWVAIRILGELVRADLPPWMKVQIDMPVLLFTLGLSVVCGIIAGLYPAFATLRRDLQTPLREGSRGAGGSRLQAQVRSALIAAELALAVVLLVAAGLLVQSFAHLQSVDTGFRRTGLVTFRTDPPWARYNKPDQTSLFYRLALEKLASLPGVTAAAANHSLPLALNQNYGKPTIVAEGQSNDEQRRNPFVNVQIVSPNYFEVMGIPLLAGRSFSVDDRLTTQPVAVVSRPLAARLFGSATPVGQRVRLPELLGSLNAREEKWFVIVGVAEGVRGETLTGQPGIDIYLSNQQQFVGDTFFVLRTSQPLARISSLAAATIREVDPEQPIFAVRAIEDLVEETVWQRKIAGHLGASFAVIAVLLAAVGVYSLLAWIVSQRTRELAIRQALGSTPAEVRMLVVKQGIRLAVAGIAAGLLLAIPAARSSSNLLFGVSVWDPTSLVGAAVTVLLMVLIASYIPAIRASNVN